MNIYDSLEKTKIYRVKFGKEELYIPTLYRISPIELWRLTKFKSGHSKETLTE